MSRHYQVTPQTHLVASRCEEEKFLLRDMSTASDHLHINADRHTTVIPQRGVATELAPAGADSLKRLRQRPSG